MCQKVFHVGRNKVNVLPARTLLQMTSTWSHTRCLQEPPHNQADGVKNLGSVSFRSARMCCVHLLGTYHKGCLKGLRKCTCPVVTDLVASQIKYGDRLVLLVTFPVTAFQPRRTFFSTIANSRLHRTMSRYTASCEAGFASNPISRVCCRAYHAIPQMRVAFLNGLARHICILFAMWCYNTD